MQLASLRMEEWVEHSCSPLQWSTSHLDVGLKNGERISASHSTASSLSHCPSHQYDESKPWKAVERHLAHDNNALSELSISLENTWEGWEIIGRTMGGGTGSRNWKEESKRNHSSLPPHPTNTYTFAFRFDQATRDLEQIHYSVFSPIMASKNGQGVLKIICK